MYYFSYGSNMSIRRLQSRVPSASKYGIATLYGHELRFHKPSKKDGSGKCDICETKNPEHFVIGVVFEIELPEKPLLDKAEGLGSGYKEKIILIEVGGELINAFTYWATKIDSALKPLSWYKEHVLRGAYENQFPEDYIQLIIMVESTVDHDKERHERELAIYS
jgi:hypothetical protein